MRVNKREIIIVTVSFISALAIGSGVLVWHGHQRHARQLSSATAGSQDDSESTVPEDAGSLSVNSQASDLGQLGTGVGQAQSSQDSQNNSGGSSGGDLNPASFGQYNKYQSSKNALFGDIQKGTGAQLGAGQKASIYYKAWLANGALVDRSPVSSSGQPQPFMLTLGAHKVILGLEQGLAGMKAGGKRLIIVPPAVGYGSEGQGAVPPNTVMVFEVQLVSVQ